MASSSNSKQQQQKYLPEEMLIDVLRRLPVKSLIRCMCVCKTWLSIIRTTSFAKTHLIHHQKTSSNKYILYEDSRLCTLLTDSDPLFDVTKLSKLYYTPQLFERDDVYCGLRIYGVCNGLLCLSDQAYSIGDNIHLWNPICRKAKKLPQLEINYDNDNSSMIKCGVSFGYYNDDYKVIVIAYVNHTYIVYVYSLSTNSWNIIHTNFCFKELTIDATKFVQDTVYMITSGRVVVCFRLSDETIRVIDFPEEFQRRGGITMEAYGETIALLGECENNDSKYLTMWILRDKSWEIKFSINLQQDIGYETYTHAEGFLNNGKYLVRTLIFKEDFFVTKLFWCDLEFPKLTEFRSLTELRRPHGRPPYPCLLSQTYSNFMESLLLLNEDRLDPFVNMEMEESSSCSSMLFTFQWDVT